VSACRCRETALAGAGVFFAARTDRTPDGRIEFPGRDGEALAGWVHVVGSEAGALVFQACARCPRCGGRLAQRSGCPEAVGRGR
jgi:hypothetical protein